MTTLFTSTLPLILFAAVATISPGGATTLATASGVQFGFRRSIPLLAGISFGLASLACASALGLAAVLLAAPLLQTLVKGIGTVYLLWLAWKVGSSGAPASKSASSAPLSLFNGIYMLWLNPKAWAMTLGAAASFATLTTGALQLSILLGLVFAAASSISLAFWCLAGALFARILKTPLQWRILNVILGVLLAISIIPMWT